MAIRRTSPINIVQTWDDAEKKFNPLTLDITTSGFAGGNAASRAFEIRVDGTVVFAVNASGNVTAGGAVGAPVVVSTTPNNLTPAAHAGRLVVMTKTDGWALVLPAATGSGAKYEIVIGAAVASSSTIKVTTTDIMQGLALGSDDDGVPANSWATAVDSDTITLDGTTRGGGVGDKVILQDIASAKWSVLCFLKQTGTEATPFSATVS